SRGRRARRARHPARARPPHLERRRRAVHEWLPRRTRHRERLARKGIVVHRERITRIDHQGGLLTSIVLASHEMLPIVALATWLAFRWVGVHQAGMWGVVAG